MTIVTAECGIRFIEVRKPNFHISAGLAKDSGLEVDYIKMKGIDDDYYKLIEEISKKGRPSEVNHDL